MDFTLERIESEKCKFYLIIPLWICYFLLLPKIYLFSKIVFFLYIFLIGNFLFCWLGFLFHETWHEYIPNIKNKTLYYIYGILLLTDPHIINM